MLNQGGCGCNNAKLKEINIEIHTKLVKLCILLPSAKIYLVTVFRKCFMVEDGSYTAVRFLRPSKPVTNNYFGVISIKV